MPAPAPPPPAPPPPPQTPDEAAKAAGDAQKKVAQNAAGPGSTILTGPQGLTTPATTNQKTLLGQ
jgi:hypothetical protein